MTSTRFDIGPHRPVKDAQSMTGVYVGVDASLKDERAILGLTADDKLVAQFNNPETGYAYGWHVFDSQDFAFDGPEA